MVKDYYHSVNERERERERERAPATSPVVNVIKLFSVGNLDVGISPEF